LTESSHTNGQRPATARLHLTAREIEILGHVLRGDGNKQIAAALGVTEQAIKERVSTMLSKFDVPNRAALAEAGSRFEFLGEPGADRSWMRDMFLGAEPLIVVARGPEIRYEAGNEAFAKAIGHRPFIGRTMREVFPELAGQGIYESTERVFATGVPTIEHESARSWDRGNGVENRLMDTVIQPLHDEKGAVNGILGFSVDVTDLVQQRRRSEILREEMAALLDLVPSGVIVVDESGRVVKINEAAQRIIRLRIDPDRDLVEQLGSSPELRDATGRPVTLDDLPIRRALKGETVGPVEFSFVSGTPPERVRIVSSVRTLRDPDSRVRGVLVVFNELGAEPA
jgi:PAS domain-containing protein